MVDEISEYCFLCFALPVEQIELSGILLGFYCALRKRKQRFGLWIVLSISRLGQPLIPDGVAIRAAVRTGVIGANIARFVTTTRRSIPL